MDGVGIGRQDDSNAVYLAETPILDSLFKTKLYTRLQAHGTAVGLPTDDDMGNQVLKYETSAFKETWYKIDLSSRIGLGTGLTY